MDVAPHPRTQVFAVVKFTQQTSVSASSPVMTVKGTNTAVQTASSDFYVDAATGSMMLRTSSQPECSVPSTTSTLAASPVQPQVLQTAPFSVNATVRKVTPSTSCKNAAAQC